MLAGGRPPQQDFSSSRVTGPGLPGPHCSQGLEYGAQYPWLKSCSSTFWLELRGTLLQGKDSKPENLPKEV